MVYMPDGTNINMRFTTFKFLASHIIIIILFYFSTFGEDIVSNVNEQRPY